MGNGILSSNLATRATGRKVVPYFGRNQEPVVTSARSSLSIRFSRMGGFAYTPQKGAIQG